MTANKQKFKCPSCGSCGIPMEKASDFGGNKVDNAYCVFCSDENGNLSVSFEDVVNFYTKDFVKRRGLDSTRAKQIASETVARFPAWSGNS